MRRITVTESFAEIDLGGRRARVDYATIPGARWSRARLDALRDALQAAIDLRVPRAALPDGDPDGIRGVEITRLGPRAYLENVEREQVGRRSHYWIRHDRPPTEEPGEGTDVWAVRNGRVSITPIDLVLTDEVDSAPLRS
ncbi:MAG: hypothetical protein IH805_06555, partial [Proteobacteria bacterium]|nr:hypothetical protein [Pseudomonadota bacterium]